MKPALIIAVNAIVLLLLIATVAWVKDLNSTASDENAALRREIETARLASSAARAEATRRLQSVQLETAKRINELEQELRVRGEAHAALLESRKTFEDRAAAREKAVLDDTRGMIEARITEMDSRIADRMKAIEKAMAREAERFHSIQREWDGSIFLVHAKFSYKTRDDGGRQSEHVGTGWGTAFAIRKDGYLVTNKHVVQPWKFDPELSAMEALGEVEIIKDQVLIAAWQSGTVCMTEDRKPDFTKGFNTRLGNLEVAMAAPDSMTTKVMEIAGTSLDYAVHDLDDNDLVLLKIDDDDDLRPVTCAPFADGNDLEKLDRVMALGFPRGQRGLEAMCAESSPSLGTVRKVENTIHITASIIPGNSGGPVFNRDGEVVGIATRIYSETLGICLKIDHALDLMAVLDANVAAAKADARKSAAVVSDVRDPK